MAGGSFQRRRTHVTAIVTVYVALPETAVELLASREIIVVMRVVLSGQATVTGGERGGLAGLVVE